MKQADKTKSHTGSSRTHNADHDEVISQIFCPSCRGSQEQLQRQDSVRSAAAAAPFPEPVDVGSTTRYMAGPQDQGWGWSGVGMRDVRQKENTMLALLDTV